MKTQKDIRLWAKNIIDRDETERNPMWREIERVFHLEYQRPPGTEEIEGYHAVVKPAPYKDILVAKNAYALSTPRIKIDPWDERLAGKEVANKREQALKWWYSKLNNRRGESVQASILESSFLYGAVCMQTSHTEYTSRATEEKTGRRMKFHAQHGPFAWEVYNPMDVHWQTSIYGLERVVSVKVRDAQEVLDTWGAAADALRSALDAKRSRDGQWRFKHVTEFYYCDPEVVYIWAIPCTETVSASADAGNFVDIIYEENKLPFLNWVIQDASSSLERQMKYKNKPLLWYTVQSGAWETDCTLGSLQMTKGIQNAAKPDWLIQKMGDNFPKFDYKRVVGGAILYDIGQKPEETQPAKFDVGLAQLQQQLGTYQSQTGVSEALAGQADAETFAGQNLLVQTGRASIASGLEIAQRAIAEGCLQNLQWLVFIDEPARAKGVEGDYVGREIEMNPREIEVDKTYITVELSNESEGTRIQQANVGALARQNGLSNETALEWMGIDNPEAELKRRRFEEMAEALWQLEIKKLNAAVDLQIAQAQAQIQQQMQMDALAQAQAASAPVQPGGDAAYYEQTPMNPTPDIGYDIQGQGYNPAAGGIPPAQVNPNATFEGQTGTTRSGAPI